VSQGRGARESYLLAASTSDLTLKPGPCDADKLLAAAYASSGDPRKQMALRVYRLKAAGSMEGAKQLAAEMSHWLVSRSMPRKGGYLRRGSPELPRVTAQDLAMTVLKWRQKPTCRSCLGRRHPLIPGAPVLDTTRTCSECHGTGEVAIERLVRSEHADAARWLVGELDAMTAMVFSDMARRLAPLLEL
jgi:hypothetical protein